MGDLGSSSPALKENEDLGLEGKDHADEKDEEESEEIAGDGLWVFLILSLGKMVIKRLGFCSFLVPVWLELKRYEGGGVSGGIVVEEMGFFGVPGWDSHTKGTAPGARP